MKLPAASREASLFSSPLTGEDHGGGEDMLTLPPPLAPPTKGGEFKECQHAGSEPLAKTDRSGRSLWRRPIISLASHEPFWKASVKLFSYL
jgi:hypothetical protein